MATTVYSLYYVVQKTSSEIAFKFLNGLMYGIKEAIQLYISYVSFPRNIYGGHPGITRSSYNFKNSVKNIFSWYWDSHSIFFA